MDECQIPSADIVVVIDNMSCSSCIVEVVKTVNARKTGSVAIVVSEGNYSTVKKLVQSPTVVIDARPTSVIQKCFPSPTNLSINRRTTEGLERLLDVGLNNTDSAVTLIERL